jgi:exodeoxyribonuclease VII large subunit
VRSEPEREVWTVAQVNRAVRNLLEGTIPPFWVSGEVGGWTRARSGHCYFTLKDRQAQIRGVMWRTEAERLPTDPDEGMEVKVFGSLTLYEGRGEYQLVARVVEAGGAEGLWKLAFERLRKKLDAEGLLALERKRPLPRCPATVGVVTSTSGAALKDILTTIRRRAPWTRVVVRNARVQGDGAALEVAEAVRALARSGLVDVLIVGRGGGSIEDLWAFNEEPVARAIAASPVPVISAVGHEVDVTISDLVADVRAATPSAAAEAAVHGSAQVLDGLRRLPPRLSRGLQSAAARRKRALVDERAALFRTFQTHVARRRLRLERTGERLEKVVRWTLERRRQRLIASAGKLDALSPLATLRRGFSVALAPDGRVLRRIVDFTEGTPFTLRVQDGRVACEAGRGVEVEAPYTLEVDPPQTREVDAAQTLEVDAARRARVETPGPPKE